LQLDAKKTVALAPEVAKIMAGELGWSKATTQTQLDVFAQLAKSYAPSS
jgi:hypothetical protein